MHGFTPRHNSIQTSGYEAVLRTFVFSNYPEFWIVLVKNSTGAESKDSIFIDFWPTNRISRKTDIGFGIPTSNNLQENYFWKIRCSLVTGRPMEFRGEWTLDSNSRPRIIFGEAQSAMRFWLSCDLFRPISKIRTDKQAENYFYYTPLHERERIITNIEKHENTEL